MEERAKYGRPPLGNNKRNITIQICLNNDEFEKLQKRFGEENMSPKLRKFILNTEDRIHSNDDESFQVDKEIVYELKKIGNNLNQIAFKINVGEQVSDEEISNHLKDLQQILKDKLS